MPAGQGLLAAPKPQPVATSTPAPAQGNPNTASGSAYYGSGGGEAYQSGYVTLQATATPYIEPVSKNRFQNS
jgi:hypothetical protein